MVLGVYIIRGNSDAGSVQYWSKAEMINKYTVNKLPTIQAADIPADGQVTHKGLSLYGPVYILSPIWTSVYIFTGLTPFLSYQHDF